jgi:hypothetical protein
VFEQRDPMPSFALPIANWFHVTSRKAIIEQEMLLAPGERYDQALVDQTARNLRALPQLSLVLLVPVRGSGPGRVRILVITKDVWSLRLNSSWVFENGRLLQLLLQPSEENLAGIHHVLLGNFLLDPATISLGGSYQIPRIAGSRVATTASANAIVNRDTGQAEGSSGSLSAGQPLYSIRAQWAWAGSFSWTHDIRRYFIGGERSVFDAASGTCAPVQSGDVRTPCQYQRTIVNGSASLVRSFGSEFKEDMSLGFAAVRAEYAASDPAFASALVPRSDSRVGPSLSLHVYSSRYLDLLDMDTLGLIENVQRGHDLTVKVTPVTRALGSTRDFVDLLAQATYTLPVSDGLLRASVQSDVAFAKDTLPDASIDGSARFVSPRFGLGRIVVDARLLDRYRNYLNARSTLGGDGRLRGYAAGLFSGANLAVANLEFRSAPLALFAVQFGAALFYDAGDAFDSFDRLKLKQSCGAGLRVLFPQLQRYVMRIDLGIPLTRGPWTSQPDVVITFNQAIPAIGN